MLFWTFWQYHAFSDECKHLLRDVNVKRIKQVNDTDYGPPKKWQTEPTVYDEEFVSHL